MTMATSMALFVVSGATMTTSCFLFRCDGGLEVDDADYGFTTGPVFLLGRLMSRRIP